MHKHQQLRVSELYPHLYSFLYKQKYHTSQILACENNNFFEQLLIEY